MTRSSTNPVTGRRVYLAGKRPMRPMFSITTLNKAMPKELEYAAGKASMDATLAVACEVAADLSRTPFTEDDLLNGGIPATFETFEFDVLEALRAKYGVVKSTGQPIPPHRSLWTDKRDVGSIVHQAVEGAIKTTLGQVPPPPMDQSPLWASLSREDRERAETAFAMFRAWRAAKEFVPLASEDVVWLGTVEDGVPHDVAARLDIACILGGRRVILDLKTGKLDKKGPYPEQMIQVEMQRRGANARKLAGGGFEAAGILHVPAAGGTVRVFLNDDRDRDEDMAQLARNHGTAIYLWGPPTMEEE